MLRRDALLRLRRTLLARGADLREKLADELANLRNRIAADSAGDSADVAFETTSDEMWAQLAELDAHELSQIERALRRLREGTYGNCDGGSENCQKRIPLARLNALPYTTYCIYCEREMERYSNWFGRRASDNWNHVFDWEASLEHQRTNLPGLEMDLSRNR